MKSISSLLLILLVATALAVPGESAAQTVCEGFSTVLKAMKRSRDREKLEFYSLPGATCRLDSDSYICDWPRPRPPNSAGVAAFRGWYRIVSNEMKTLAGAFQQCINQKKVPYKWDTFEKETRSGRIRSYYIYTERRPEISVVLCVRRSDRLLPENQEHTGASLRLEVHKGHKDYCGIL